VPGDAPDPPLGPRAAHPLTTHALVDMAVAFLATVILGLILGVSIGVIIGVSVVAGLCLAPFTHRTEVRQLAARDEATDPDARPHDPRPHDGS